MGRVLLFGTIKMPNFATIYYNEKAGSYPKINGLSGDALGKSDNGSVNGVAAFTQVGSSTSIIQATTPEDVCAGSPSSTIWVVNRGGEITSDSLIFDNASGFSQVLSSSYYYRSDGSTPSYQMGGSVDVNGYYPLVYVQDCRG